jgi:hypothetical protein
MDSARRRAAIAANPELQEREALKGLGLTASMADALTQRGVPDMTACVAAQLGALALKIAYDRWIDATNDDTFSTIARQTLNELHAASVGQRGSSNTRLQANPHEESSVNTSTDT